MAKKAVLTEYRLTVPQLRQPLTIAHVSDLHERDATDILALLQTVQPDLIAVTGDSFERFANGETDERFRR
ncbi:MAG: metallophosphoesterase, partial [Ruminococcus sp.]|nr:metallophosphoesterase [Ruminococcus sp.]